MRDVIRAQLEEQDYEVLCAEDGFEGLIALKRSLPDLIISDLRMPNMSGFEFLSIVRRRFSNIPVIAISSEFSTLSLPESVLADAFFQKGEYELPELFKKIAELLETLPSRPRVGKLNRAAVWVKTSKGILAVTCSECLRTFPVSDAIKGVNEAECDFCGSHIRFEVINEPGSTLAAS